MDNKTKILNIFNYIFMLIIQKDPHEILHNFNKIKNNLNDMIIECGNNLNKMDELCLKLKPFVKLCAEKQVLIGFNFISTHILAKKNNLNHLMNENDSLKQHMIEAFVNYQQQFTNLLNNIILSNEFFRTLVVNSFENEKRETFNLIKNRIRSTIPNSPKSNNKIWNEFMNNIFTLSENWNEYYNLSDIIKKYKTKKYRELFIKINNHQLKSCELLNKILLIND